MLLNVKSRLLGGASALAAVLLIAVGHEPAKAQEAVEQTAQAPQVVALEEIIVTARKRAESQQDVPIAVTALSSSDLELRSISDISNVARTMPNVNFSNSSSGSGTPFSTSFYIRGIGQNQDLIGTDPGVATYVDGIYVSRAIGALFDVVDFQSVEVLRGPQGTLFGKNTIGGAVNITTQRPDEEWGGYFDATVGNFSRIDLKAALNAVLIPDTVLARISVARLDRGGYVERVKAGDTQGDQDTLAGRAVIEVRAEENLRFTFSADGNDTDGTANYLKLVQVVNSPTAAPALHFWNQFIGTPTNTAINASDLNQKTWTTTSDGPNVSRLNSWGFAGTVDWEASSALSVKSISAWRGFKSYYFVDLDGTDGDAYDTEQNQDQTQFTQEVQLTGETANARINWLFGAFYMREEIEELSTRTTPRGLYNAGGPPPRNNITFDPRIYDVFQDVRSLAGFGQATFAVTDALNVTGGLRYTDERKTFGGETRRQITRTVAVPYYTNEKSWNAWTPMGSIDFKPMENTLLYASASRGFKSGGMPSVPINTVAITKTFDQETVWSYEAGIKADWLGGRLRTNAAVFHSKYDDIQLSFQLDGTLQVINCGNATIEGAELEVLAEPIAGLTLDASAGYMPKARVDNVIAECTNSGVREGARLPRTPKWTGNLGLQYRFDVGQNGQAVAMRGDVSHQSKYFNSPNELASIAEDGYVTVNGRITYFGPDEKWQLSLYGKNLFNEAYIVGGTDGISGFGFALAAYNRPREYGLSMKFGF